MRLTKGFVQLRQNPMFVVIYCTQIGSSKNPLLNLREWGAGYYNGDIKTRKTVQLQHMEISANRLGMQRSEQLRELYESLAVGESKETFGFTVSGRSVVTNTHFHYQLAGKEEYDTATRGHRHTSPARALAEGIYRILRHKPGGKKTHTHLIYSDVHCPDSKCSFDLYLQRVPPFSSYSLFRDMKHSLMIAEQSGRR